MNVTNHPTSMYKNITSLIESPSGRNEKYLNFQTNPTIIRFFNNFFELLLSKDSIISRYNSIIKNVVITLQLNKVTH